MSTTRKQPMTSTEIADDAIARGGVKQTRGGEPKLTLTITAPRPGSAAPWNVGGRPTDTAHGAMSLVALAVHRFAERVERGEWGVVD